MIDYEKFKEYDRNKTKVLKYVIYKKRTEYEIRKKFENDIDNDLLEDIINELKENDYIDDSQYIKKSVNEYIKLNNLSLKQIKYKLITKGISDELIEEYFYSNEEDLDEYEIKSIINIINKKNGSSDEETVQKLLKKGFKYDNLKEALERRD